MKMNNKKLWIIGGVVGGILLIVLIVVLLKKEKFAHSQEKELRNSFEKMGYDGDLSKLIIDNEQLIRDIDIGFSKFSTMLENKSKEVKDMEMKNKLILASKFFLDLSKTIKCHVLGECNNILNSPIVKPVVKAIVDSNQVKTGVAITHLLVDANKVDHNTPSIPVIKHISDKSPNKVIVSTVRASNEKVVVEPSDVLPHVIPTHYVVISKNTAVLHANDSGKSLDTSSVLHNNSVGLKTLGPQKM